MYIVTPSLSCVVSLQDDIQGKIKDEGVTCLRLEYIVDIQQDPPPVIDQFIV